MSIRIGFSLYEIFDSLDVLGPFHVFTYSSMTPVLVAGSASALTSLEGVGTLLATTLAACGQLGILFVPGGSDLTKVLHLGPPSIESQKWDEDDLNKMNALRFAVSEFRADLRYPSVSHQMPLSKGAPALIRANLEAVQNGNRVRPVVIGTLTDAQLDAINEERRACGYSPVVKDVVFMGGHVYASRIERDGYTIDDVLEQIAGGMDSAAVVLRSPTMTAMENPVQRTDRYGNSVRDRAIFRVFRPVSPARALLSHAERRRPFKTEKAPQKLRGFFIQAAQPGKKCISDSPAAMQRL